MKTRYRPPGDTPRKNTIPIRFTDNEYRLLIDAGFFTTMTVSAFIAEAAIREATRVAEENKKVIAARNAVSKKKNKQ